MNHTRTTLLMGFLGLAIGIGTIQLMPMNFAGYETFLPIVLGFIFMTICHIVLSKKNQEKAGWRNLVSKILLFVFFLSLLPVGITLILLIIAAVTLGLKSCGEIPNLSMAALLCFDIYSAGIGLLITGAISSLLYSLSYIIGRNRSF